MARILLIEDDDSVRTTLSLILEHVGHTVVEAGDGREGLNLFRRAGADLVITDMVMPGTEGVEVLRELRRTHAPVKIIAMSGAARGAAYLEMARLLGAAKVLAKPFPTALLLAAVDELLPGDAARA